jgi:methyltransferase (TIGR00027 family)
MENSGQSSLTAPSLMALTSAAARAAHLIVDHEPLIFSDTLAAAFLADRAEELLSYHRSHSSHPVLAGARVTVTTRSRYTEDRLAGALRRGVTQYVILGAGLDSFACRSPLARRVRVIEADHPGTQRWKRRMLADTGTAALGDLRYAEADLEGTALPGQLASAGFDFSRPALVSLLGVTMYLTRTAVAGTLSVIGRCAPGTELIAEYAVPADLRDTRGREYARLVGPAAAERGEPWRTFLDPAEMSALLDRHGFGEVRHVGQHDMVDGSLWSRTDALQATCLFQLADGLVRAAP